MMLKSGSFKILGLLIFSLANFGCDSNYKLRDQNSEEEEQKIEYADFSQFPLPSSPDQLSGESPTPSEPQPPVELPKQTPQPPQPVQKMTGIGTVYYIPVYGEKRSCSKDEQAYVKDESDKILAQLCKSEVVNCGLQGSCFYVDEEGVSLFAYKKTVEVKVPETSKTVFQYRFSLNKELSRCPQGMGAWRVCLDPYRSVAADPKFHKMGDVVYLPLLVGQKLPNNETHDGYFIVRDTGNAIKGEGRFDFFIGFDDYKKHLFTKLKLNDKKNGHFDYYRVPEDIAQKIRVARAYPSVPTKVHEQAYAGMMSALGLDKNLDMISAAVEFYRMKWN